MSPAVLLPVEVVLLVVLAAGSAAASAALTARAAGLPAAAGLLAPGREAARLLVAQGTTTAGADRLLARTGAALLPVAALMTLLVVPLLDTPLLGTAGTALPVGIVWFNAMEVLAWVAVWLVGWGSDSAFGVIGANRFLAQGLAYELPHMFALTSVAIAAGSLNVSDVVAAQQIWYVIPMPVAFVVFLLSALAFSVQPPFAQALGSDAAGGAIAQLSGTDRLLFLAGRHLFLAAAAAAAAAMFLGGPAGPFFPGWVWQLGKSAAVLAVLIVLGRRFPTVPVARFTEFSWVVLLPLTVLQALVVSILVLMGWL